MEKGMKLIIWAIVIIAVGFIAITQYKNYLIKQIFAKGLLEDTPLNRTALANQSILQVLQTLRNIKAPGTYEAAAL
jgi:Tfp pilus assembly major pilin PilA